MDSDQGEGFPTRCSWKRVVGLRGEGAGMAGPPGVAPGSHEAVAVPYVPPVTVSDDPKENQDVALEAFCRPFAGRFRVSAEAMRIRLERMEFLLREVPNTLF